MKRRLLIVALMMFCLFSVAILVRPQKAYASTGNNTLLLVGEHCHDLTDLEHNFNDIQNNPQGDSNSVNECHGKNGDVGWDALLNKSLGCTTEMFYTHDFHNDPHDNSVVTTKWYTHESAYKYCYNQALANLTVLDSLDCATMKEGSGNWNKCQQAQNNLYVAVGCESKMFQDLHNGYWGIKPAAASNCFNQVAAVGNVHIVVMGADGSFAPDPNPISSSAIAATDPTSSGGSGSGSSSGSGGSTPSVGCDIGITFNSVGDFAASVVNTFNPLNWMLCGILQGTNLFVKAIDNLIINELPIGTDSTSTDNPNHIFSSGGGCTAAVKTDSGGKTVCDDYQTAWASFRDIALGLLVVVGLIVVISQALGFEILDAYMVRKMLPRVLIATIAITLSWELMRFAVIVSNDLGYGVGSLITAPFGGFSQNFQLGEANTLLASLALGAAAAFLDLFGLLTFALTAALAVLVAYIVLMLRQIVVILLAIISPIAILAYVLPNTQRFYKFWWESFSKLLLMFPLIVGFIAIGRVFATIAQNSGGSFINQITAYIAYFGPYFAIPMTFRFAGSIMGTVGNAVNNHGLTSGARGLLSNYRSNQAKKKGQEYAHKWRTGGFTTMVPARFRRLNRLNQLGVKAVNAAGRRSSAGLMRGALGFGARGESALEGSLMEGAEAAGKEHGMQENATINAFNRLMVLTAKHKGNEAMAVKELRDWYSSDRNEYNRAFQGHDLEDKINDARGRMRNVGGYTPARAVASYLAMGRDGTAIRDVRDSGEIAAWVSEGSATTAYNLLSQVASDSKRGGRAELAPSQENKAALVGATVKAHNGINVPDYDAIVDRATMSGAGGEGAYNILLNAPSRVIRGNVEHAMDIIRRYKTDPTSVDFKDAAQAASVVQDLKNNVEAGYGKPDNKITFHDAMASGDREKLLSEFLNDKFPSATITDDYGNQVPVIKPRAIVDDHGEEVVTPGPRVGDYVQQLVGANTRRLSEEQRENDIQEQARQAREQAEQNQQR